MYLTRHQTTHGPCWAVDGCYLPMSVSLSLLLSLPTEVMMQLLGCGLPGEVAEGRLLAPVDPLQEIWAAGVTYLRSRDARQAESRVGDVYERVYDAERPELFLKCIGWRAQGHGMPIHIRTDSRWNVPEPELTIVANRQGEIIGYCAGNDMSSRDIEGENPLYLPQAKVYNRSCAIGPGIVLASPDEMRDLPIDLVIRRGGAVVFTGNTRVSQMKRRLQELVSYLQRETDFPYGLLLMTGTGIVPPDDFSLRPGDVVRITVGQLTLENPAE